MSLGEKKETVTLIEWERKLGSSWSPDHLLPTDPTHFTDLTGQVATSKQETDLPDGYVWVSDWELLKSRTTEEEGWEYAWNVTASTWKPKDQGAFVRRRKWMRQRKLVASLVGAAADKSGDQVVDLTSVPLVYTCNAARSKREIAAMVGKDESTATLLWGGSTVSFLAGWSSLFSDQNGRTTNFSNQASLIVVRGLTDPDVLSAVLLPMLTESGEYRAGKEGVSALGQRLSKVAIVLAPWEGPPVLLIDRLQTDKGVIPPIRIAIHQLE
jgi:hypothetical protein